MDQNSAIIGTVMALLFIGPILYMILKQQNKNKKRLKDLENICSNNQMKPNEIELSNSLMLGLDSSSKKLIIVEPKNNMQYDIIDLSKINSSHIAKKGPSVNGDKNPSTITHLSLELSKSNGKEKVTEIVFYDEDDDSSDNYDTQLFIANKWDRLIKSNLSA